MTSIRDSFDMVVFDWAGTMVDFGSRAPVLALMEAFAVLGAPVSEEEARRDMGRAKADHVRALFEQPRINQAWQAAHREIHHNFEPVLELVRPQQPVLGPYQERQFHERQELVDGGNRIPLAEVQNAVELLVV